MPGVPPTAKQVFKDEAGRVIPEAEVANLMYDGRHAIERGKASGDVHEFIIRLKTPEEVRREFEQDLANAREIAPRKAPDPTFTDLEGATVAGASLRGSVIVLNFWFTTCKPCLAEIPELNRLVERYAPRGVVFVAPSRDDAPRLRRFLGGHRFDFRVCAAATDLIKRFEVEGYPTNVVIDRAGMMIMHASGWSPATVARVERAIARALGDPPPKPAAPTGEF